MPLLLVALAAPIAALGGAFWAFGNAAEKTGTATQKAQVVLTPLAIAAMLGAGAFLIWELKRK